MAQIYTLYLIFYDFVNNGKKKGVAISWHPNGSLEMIANYINGQLYGNYTLWYNSGNIMEKGNYYLESVNNYIDSCFDSVYAEDTLYEYDDGISYVSYSGGYNFDKKSIHFLENGKVNKEELWKEGMLIWRKEYDEEGNLIKE